MIKAKAAAAVRRDKQLAVGKRLSGDLKTALESALAD
jgi:hypothetical protein